MALELMLVAQMPLQIFFCAEVLGNSTAIRTLVNIG
jgi:hypothetical protein